MQTGGGYEGTHTHEKEISTCLKHKEPKQKCHGIMGIKLVLDVGFGTSERFPTIVIAKHEIHHGIV